MGKINFYGGDRGGVGMELGWLGLYQTGLQECGEGWELILCFILQAEACYQLWLTKK